MEYMVAVQDDWDTNGFGTDGFFTAQTLDGKPIMFGAARISILREVDEKEYEIWRKSLSDYREAQLKKAQEEAK